MKLQVLKIGDGAEGYQNGNLTELTLGNNTLLHHLDVRNCPNLKMAVDLSGCTNIETVLFDGTSITGLSLPNGGILKTLHLPGTVTNLTVLNQRAITVFVLPSYSQITTLRLENVSDAVPVREIFAAIPASSRVRLIGIDWAMESAADILTLYDRLDTMRGLDENDGNMDKAQVSGVLRVPTLTGAELAEMKSRYPYIEIAYESISSYLYFYDETGTNLLAMATVEDGGDGVYQGTTPTKAQTAQYTYTFAGWSLTPGGSANPDALKGVTADRSVYAAFTATVRTYTVRWYNGTTLLETDTGVPYGTVPAYNGSTPVDAENGQPFIGWEPAVAAITGNTDYTAKFEPLVDYDAPWQAVFDSIDAGTYKTDYAIGDLVPLNLGSEGVVNMQIAGFDVDDLADGSGKAPISWISKELLKTQHIMNPKPTGDEGTGAYGGWEKCEMRTYLKETIKPLIPDTVRNKIVSVIKTQTAYDTTQTSFSQTTEDDVWLPTRSEMRTEGVYKAIFNDGAMRSKTIVETTSAIRWWNRDADNYAAFCCINADGVFSSNTASEKYGIALGFCT